MSALQKGIINFLIFLFSTMNILFAQMPNKIDWKKDLEIYKTSLEQKHIDLYHSATKEEFANDWNKIYNSVDSLNDFEIILKLMRLTRLINDGHTSVSMRAISTHRFPFGIQQIEGKWRVVKTLLDNKHILKTTLESINGIPIDEVILKVSEIAQFVENDYSLRERTGSYLPIAELLHQLHFIDAPNTATFGFRDMNDKLIEIELDAVADSIWAKDNKLSKMLLTVPEIERPKTDQSDLWFAPISNTNALYIDFKSYPTFAAMQRFGQQVVSYIQDHQIEQVVIDMRENGGGDLYVGVVLAYALNLADSIDWKNGVFVLTSNTTFSAATSNAALFKHLLNAKIIGQPTGSNPNGYQDMDSFTLPNSKLVITYSKRLFRLSEEQGKALMLDILITPEWNLMVEGIDPVLKELMKELKN